MANASVKVYADSVTGQGTIYSNYTIPGNSALVKKEVLTGSRVAWSTEALYDCNTHVQNKVSLNGSLINCEAANCEKTVPLNWSINMDLPIGFASADFAAFLALMQEAFDAEVAGTTPPLIGP